MSDVTLRRIAAQGLIVSEGQAGKHRLPVLCLLSVPAPVAALRLAAIGPCGDVYVAIGDEVGPVTFRLHGLAMPSARR